MLTNEPPASNAVGYNATFQPDWPSFNNNLDNYLTVTALLAVANLRLVVDRSSPAFPNFIAYAPR